MKRMAKWSRKIKKETNKQPETMQSVKLHVFLMGLFLDGVGGRQNIRTM